MRAFRPLVNVRATRNNMAKTQNSKKQAKKSPLKTAKEKRQAKRAKR
jgi:hypothetical protein